MRKWNQVSLASVCEVFSGFPFKSGHFIDDSSQFALVKGENVIQGRIDWAISKYWSREDGEELGRYRLAPGDVVLAMDRPWIPAGLKYAQITSRDPDSLLVQRVARLRAKHGLSQDYLYCVIGSPEFSAYVQNVGRGVGVPHISGREIGAFVVLLPPLPVQQAIADVLSAYDGLIENNRRRMALLEDSARHLYQEWFVRLRFPGHEHTRVVDGVPEDWELTTLGECLTLKRGHDLPEGDRVPGDIPIVSSSGITGFHNQKKADAPGIVTGRYGTLGEVYYVDQDYWPHNTALYVCDFKGNSPRVLFFLLKHALQSTQSNNAAVPGLNRNVLHTVKVLWPSKNLRNQFDEFLNPLFRQLGLLRTTNEKLRAARDLLLPRLMNAEVTV